MLSRSAMHSQVNFNPHSHKGSDLPWIMAVMAILYFNPHSHKGSDNSFPMPATSYDISIHTPTRGVTADELKKIADELNFNPHSHKGSDSCKDIKPLSIPYFNPHSHKGSDTKNSHILTKKNIIFCKK